MTWLAASYVVPLRVEAPDAALMAYLAQLSALVQVVVVDGSPAEVFTAHAAALPPRVVHVGVDPALVAANGKVAGVRTGLRHCIHDAVVIADDDVRHDPAALEQVVELLSDAEAVVPQNYFVGLPWHARWDTARTLLNRAWSHDYPGTIAVRRSLLERTGGYDGDVLFENLELLRTVRAAGGRVRWAPDLFVPRLPPSSAHFLGQRVRQAYDSLAQPARLSLELCLAPLGVAAVRRVGWTILLVPCLVAEWGRRRHGGAAVFPPSTIWFAPAWVAERAVCSWLAVGTRVLRGGVAYRGGRIRRAATPSAVLRRRHAGAAAAPTGDPDGYRRVA